VARAILGDPQGYNQIQGASISGAMELTYIGDPGTDYALERAFNLESAEVKFASALCHRLTIGPILW
jgi:hypothetical protein